MGYKVTLGETEFMETFCFVRRIDVRAAKSTFKRTVKLNPVHIFLQLLFFNTKLMDLTVDIPISFLDLCLSLFLPLSLLVSSALRPIQELDFLELQ